MRTVALCLSLLLAVTALVACGDAPPKCDKAACEGVCGERGQVEDVESAAGASRGALTPFERGLVAPLLEDVRAGVRPFGEDAIGICKGSGKECEAFLGTTVDELPPGEFMLRAELRVPRVGEKGTWKVRLDTECETHTKTQDGARKTSRSNSKEYEVRYVGAERGYRLSPLYKISSPAKGGRRTCTYKLVMLHPDGERTVEGGWSTPAEEG